MRRINRRFVVAGGLLLVLALGFFVVMLGMAPRSNDPQAMLQTVGMVCGVAGGLAAALIIAGLLGKKI